MNNKHQQRTSPPQRSEREFGVPVPGEILPPEHWTKTALKRLPDGPLDWNELFGRQAPRILELGCGNGRYLIGSALARPQVDHIGVDVLPVVIRYATRRGNQRGLANLRFAVRDAESFVAHNVAAGSIDEIHIYHPQPYYHPAQVGRRLLKPAFLAALHGALTPGGKLFLQTDHPAYWRYILSAAPLFFEFRERGEPWPDTPRGRTRREIIARRAGLPIFRGEGRARTGLDAAEAQRIAETLPPPVFNADRRLQALDQLE
jgi:tRNA (guanine-N7-)-methyltransferase